MERMGGTAVKPVTAQTSVTAGKKITDDPWPPDTSCRKVDLALIIRKNFSGLNLPEVE